MKLLIDENLPPRWAHSLQALFAGEHTIVFIRDKFGRPRVTDVEWITTLGAEKNWAVLTADRRISKNQVERQAFLSSDLLGFVMAPAVRKKTITLQMARVLQMWDVFEQQSKIAQRGLFEFAIRSNKLRAI